MLHLPIHKLILKHPLGAASIDQESHRLRIRRRLGTLATHHAAVPCGALIIQHRHPARTSDRDPVPDPCAFDRIVCDRAAVNHDLGIVGPAGLTDVDGALDVGAEAGNGVMVDPNVGIVSLPWVIVDEIDPCARQSRSLRWPPTHLP